MNRLVVVAMAAGAALAATAMPTKEELRKARALVSDVTAADAKALRTKSKKPAEVAAKHMELAAQAGNEAEKYVLLQGAFKLYAKARDYEGAANVLATMNREISDMDPEVIVEIYNKTIFSSMKEKAPKLHAIKESARRQAFYRKQLAKAEVAVNANPKDAAAQKKLGECHAELGDWPKALDAFALAGGKLAKIAEAEKAGNAVPQVSGDFWWDYESGDEMSAYKFHAAELYRAALADDSFTGLARTRAEQRVKEAEKVAVDLPRPLLASSPSATDAAVQESGNRKAEKPTGKGESKKTAGDDGWEWVIPMDIHEGWRMTQDEPPAKWISADYTVPDDWAKVLGRVNIGYGDKTHRRWLRTDVVWNGDVRKVEKAEIVSVVNDVAHVWINGYEAAMDLRGGGNRDITSVFKVTIGKGKKVPLCIQLVDECGEGYGEFGIRVKMKK